MYGEQDFYRVGMVKCSKRARLMRWVVGLHYDPVIPRPS